MGYPESTNLAIVVKYPILAIWANLVVPKNAKMVGFKYRGHNHDPRARTIPLIPKGLTFEDHSLQNKRKRPVCSYIGVLSSNS